MSIGQSSYYILKDHLGSWTTITDAEGNVEQELSYDAWGNLRDPETWYNHTQADPVEAPMFDRGYTGHEHMTAFGLINMNGRCYDPMMSRFLSVDACLQDPTSAQGFNRYAYCAYNPLRYTDPTGWYMGPTDDNEGDGDGSDSGNSSAGIVIDPDSYTDYGDGWYSVGYSNGGVVGVYCWNNWKSTFSDVPSTHGQGTTYSDPSYYYPTISHSNGNGGHGTGGNIGGGNKTRQTANAVGQLTNTIVSGTSALYGCQATTIYKYPDLLTDLGKNMSKADKAKYIGKTTQAGELITAKSSARAFGDAAAKAVGKTGDVLGKIGIGIEVAQIVLTGEVDAGNVYNVVIGACGLIPGAGWVIGGVAIVGDIVSYAFTGQTIGEHIDNACGNWKHKFWDGVY